VKTRISTSTTGNVSGGGNSAVEQKGCLMTFADLCLFLGILIAFATLVVKVIEVARRK
jgi:hypothetical protein